MGFDRADQLFLAHSPVKVIPLHQGTAVVAEVFQLLLGLDPLGADGDVVQSGFDFRIWVEFRFPSGSWTRVSDVVDWGMTLHMEKVTGDWTITQPGTAK